MVYRWCVVPKCSSTSVKTPKKLFVPVPKNPKRRKKWLILARRDPKSIGPNSSVFMCEDHFNVEKDVANYLKFKMGFSKHIFSADEAFPSKFTCQQELKGQQCNACTSRDVLKWQRKHLFEESEQAKIQHSIDINKMRIMRKAESCREYRENKKLSATKNIQLQKEGVAYEIQRKQQFTTGKWLQQSSQKLLYQSFKETDNESPGQLASNMQNEVEIKSEPTDGESEIELTKTELIENNYNDLLCDPYNFNMELKTEPLFVTNYDNVSNVIKTELIEHDHNYLVDGTYFSIIGEFIDVNEQLWNYNVNQI